jgi:DNA-binding beta-propeller fold protein YncE
MTNGTYQVWFGFKGLNGIAYWSTASVTLDMTLPTVVISAPANNTSFALSRINVQGTFSDANFKQITVNGVPAFVSGTNFTALNVALNPGTNTIAAVAEDLAGNLGSNSIVAIGVTNSDGSMNDPVQIQATPIVGFSPLTVTFQITSNSAPGTFQQALYDFNGDGIADLITNNLGSLTYTYTNGQYFPVVTVQTTAGNFSSSGGWNSSDPNRLQITVQNPVIQLASISVTDPVNLKWVAPTNLYVLSGSTATLTEFDTNWNSIRTLNIGGGSPSGFDVDTSGNVYIAVTGSNQVWKFNPTNSSFQVDTNFGLGGYIGATNGATGITNGQFNAPFSVAISPDDSAISVSDSGNDRIEQFDSSGNFLTSFGTNGAAVGQFNTPKGIKYDSDGTLYVVDGGNNRIAIVQGTLTEAVTGTNGTTFGQFSNPLNITFGEHGAYVADTGNNRIQSFSLPAAHSLFSADSSAIRFVVSTNFNQPAAVVAMDDDLTTEKFWVADTANNLVRLFAIAPENVTASWTNMTAHISSGDIEGALANFSVASVDDYRDLFLATGISGTIATISQIGALSPVYIDDDRAEYYFTQTINGQTIGFPVEFVKENGVWKILEF